MPFYAYLKTTKKPQLKQYNPDPQTVGEHIRKKRIEAGLLQKDVAAIIGTDVETITGWESHRSKPIVSHYPAIIRFLGYYPLDHSVDTVAGLIERCRHCLGLSYENFGKRIGVHGSTVMYWKDAGVIFNRDCKEKMLHLLNTQCLPV